MKRAWFAIAAAFAFGCGGGQPSSPSPPASKPISSIDSNYLNEILGIMQANALYRDTIDWNSVHSQVFGKASTAQTIPDTYPAIQLALGLLGDHHSFYTSAAGTTIANPVPKSCNAPATTSPTVPPGVGYVRIAPCCSGVSAMADADAIQQQIRTSDGPGLVGWIVDLRGNTGGDMWPMLAGVGPVLGEGTAGFFIAPHSVPEEWHYQAGAAILSGAVLVQASNPYRLMAPSPNVAVLTDNLVASSGEAIVVAFRGRANTRSFGTPTCGLSTANTPIGLSDGATLFLTTAVMADRTQTKYGDSIVPDEIISDTTAAAQRAIDWLRSF